MKSMQMAVKRFWADEEGVTAIEYGLLAALIAVMIIVGAKMIGVELDKVFQYIGGELKDAQPPAPGA